MAAAEADLRQNVETQFLRYFEARALKEIADASERELGDEVEVARARLASGVITRADMLRIEVAVANAHQQALQANSQAQTAHATLLALIGAGTADAGVTLVEPRDAAGGGAHAARTPRRSAAAGARAPPRDRPAAPPDRRRRSDRERAQPTRCCPTSTPKAPTCASTVRCSRPRTPRSSA